MGSGQPRRRALGSSGQPRRRTGIRAQPLARPCGLASSLAPESFSALMALERLAPARNTRIAEEDSSDDSTDDRRTRRGPAASTSGQSSALSKFEQGCIAASPGAGAPGGRTWERFIRCRARGGSALRERGRFVFDAAHWRIGKQHSHRADMSCEHVYEAWTKRTGLKHASRCILWTCEARWRGT